MPSRVLRLVNNALMPDTACPSYHKLSTFRGESDKEGAHLHGSQGDGELGIVRVEGETLFKPH